MSSETKPEMLEQPPFSILDTDLYKLTMQQAVLQHYPKVSVRYRFTNRRPSDRFTRQTFDWIEAQVNKLSTLALTPEERAWLEKRCPFFTSTYLDYLSKVHLKPSEQVKLAFKDPQRDPATGLEFGALDLSVEGVWADTILYEVPLMAIISEGYFTFTDQQWDYVGQRELAYQKGKQMIQGGCTVAEFGTRRRRSYLGQRIIMEGLMRANQDFADAAQSATGKISGTSNVFLAMKYDLVPVGTIAHEWTMGVAAMEGYEGSNARALEEWEATYPGGQLSIALTDTFNSDIFFKEFKADPERARRWKGLRQDSGSPEAYTKDAVQMYRDVGVDPKSKVIVYSDGLDPERCCELKRYADEQGIGCSFGVGTNLTNDYKRVEHPTTQSTPELGQGEPRGNHLPASKALNMVIKLWEINGEPCVKISDEINKNSGDPEAVRKVKARFGLEES